MKSNTKLLKQTSRKSPSKECEKEILSKLAKNNNQTQKLFLKLFNFPPPKIKGFENIKILITFTQELPSDGLLITAKANLNI